MHQIRRSLRRALFLWCFDQAQATTNFPRKHSASGIKSVAQINDGAACAEAEANENDGPQRMRHENYALAADLPTPTLSSIALSKY
jgi:hypothetical protein